MQNLKTITVNAVTLPQVTYKGQPVLTAKAIAEVLGVTTREHININFRRNVKRFTEGTHFFRLTASQALRAGFPYPNQPKHAASRIQNVLLKTYFTYSGHGLVLFTREGLALLATTIGTDKAWAMRQTFIDAYFTLEGLATGSLTVQEGAAKAQEVVKRGQGLFAGIALQDTPSLPDGDHLRTAMALPVNRMATLQEAGTGVIAKADALLNGLTAEFRKMKATVNHAGELEKANNKLVSSLDTAWTDLSTAKRRIRELEAENAALRSVSVDLEKFNKIKDLLAS